MIRRFVLSFKAFLKAFKNPEQAQALLNGPATETKKDRSHLQLLRSLQHSGRLVDFLSEDIDSFSDAQVGAAVRQIHSGCRKSLEDLVTIRPLMEENEGSRVSIPAGYSASEVKLVGQVKGDPPYKGRIVHRGWKAHKHSLPKSCLHDHDEIITPAEIEVTT